MKPNHCYLHTTTTENPSYGIANCMVLHEKKEGKKEPLRDFAAPSFFLHKASIKQMLKPWGTALGFPTMTIPQQDPGKHFRTTVPMNAVTSEDIRGYSTPLPRYGDLQQTRHYPMAKPSLWLRKSISMTAGLDPSSITVTYQHVHLLFC